jgi:hypothetical protein
MVTTPVGARCPDCARLYKLPTYRVSTKYYLIAAGAGLGTAIICGVAWGAIDWVISFFPLNLLLAPAAGYGVGEIISLSVNRKRGVGLATVGGIATAISYIISLCFASFLSGVSFSQALSPGLFNLVYNLIALALGIFIAASRIR